MVAEAEAIDVEAGSKTGGLSNEGEKSRGVPAIGLESGEEPGEGTKDCSYVEASGEAEVIVA